MTLRIRAQAKTQILEASVWYEQQSRGLGLEFTRAIEAAFAMLARQPGLFAKFRGDIHRAPLRRFPYSVYSIEGGQDVVILRCTHHSRNPVTWPH